MEKLRDKNGREIEPGDMLKVFHFVGRNRKRHYLYQQALRYELGRLVISYMNRIDETVPWKYGENGYSIGIYEKQLQSYEIVQSIDAKFDERPKQVA